MTSRWRSERAALLGAALVALAAAPAGAQDEPGVLDLILPVQDLTLKSSRLDGSLSTSESNRRVEVTLAADVLFRFDSASLSSRARSRIAEAAAKIGEDEPPVVRVTGHTDSRGAARYNHRLSLRRAAAVAEVLRDAFPELRVEVAGAGETEPRASNRRAAGRARNRRVEISVGR